MYPCRVSPAASSRTRAVSDLARVHDIMTLNGDGDKKVGLTEFGAPTQCAERGWVSQQEQAKQITDLLAGAAATGRSGPALIYSGRDIDSANPDDREDNFGALLTMDGSRSTPRRARPVADHCVSPARIVGEIY